MNYMLFYSSCLSFIVHLYFFNQLDNFTMLMIIGTITSILNHYYNPTTQNKYNKIALLDRIIITFGVFYHCYILDNLLHFILLLTGILCFFYSKVINNINFHLYSHIIGTILNLFYFEKQIII